jgi:fibronectin type 3 domain-containing protein
VNGKGYIVKRAESSAKGTCTIIKIVNDPSITNTEDTSFIHSINYHCTIASIVEGGESNQSVPVGIYVRVPPPMNIAASFESHNNNFVSLQWDPVIKAIGYIVKRATDSPNSPFLPIGKLDEPLNTKFEDTSVLFGTNYVYSIFSRDRAGESDCSNNVSIIFPRSPSPRNVETMIPKNTGGTIVLSWSLVANCSGYKIYRMLTDLLSYTFSLASENSTESINFPVYEHQHTVNDRYSEFLLATITDPTVNSYIDSSAQNGIHYGYMIASVDGAGVSFSSKLVSGKAMLPFPTNLCAKVLHDQNTISLRWTGVPIATGYRIERKNNLGHFATIGQISNTAITEFADKKNVSYNTSYIYTIYAVYGTIESIPSSPVKVKLLSPKDQTECLDTVEVRLGNLVTEKASNEACFFIAAFNQRMK